jgi:hypothetical protein
LTTNPEPVDVALQQSLQQAGLAPSVLHDSAPSDGPAVGSTAGAGTQGTAVVGTQGTAVPGTHETDAASPHVSTAVSQPVSQTTSSAASAPPVLSASQVENVVATFLASTPNYEITVSGGNVVVVDTNVSDVLSVHFSVETFSMSDGSTLSIVGIIQHPLALNA